MSAFSALEALEAHSAMMREILTEQARRDGAASQETKDGWLLALDTDAQLADRLQSEASAVRAIVEALEL